MNYNVSREGLPTPCQPLGPTFRNRLQQVNAKMAQQQQTQEISPQKWKEALSHRDFPVS